MVSYFNISLFFAFCILAYFIITFISISNNIKNLVVLLVIMSIIKYIHCFNFHRCIFGCNDFLFTAGNAIEMCKDELNEIVEDKSTEDKSTEDNIINIYMFIILNKLFWLMVYDYYNV